MGKKLIFYKVIKTHKFSSPNWKTSMRVMRQINTLPLKMKILKTKSDERVKKKSLKKSSKWYLSKKRR